MACTALPPFNPAGLRPMLRPMLQLTALAAVAALLCAACTPQADADKNLKLHIDKFYRLHQAKPPMGALSLSELIAFRPLLSVSLFEKLKDASVAEETHFTNNADNVPPLFEGELFTARPQGFAAAQVLDCTIDDRKSVCNVELNAADTQKTTVLKWKEQIRLTDEDERGWVIDDIDYGNHPAPMRHGRLSALLQAGIDSGRTEPTQ